MQILKGIKRLVLTSWPIHIIQPMHFTKWNRAWPPTGGRDPAGL